MKSLHLVSETVKVGTELERRQARVDVQTVAFDALLDEESPDESTVLLIVYSPPLR